MSENDVKQTKTSTFSNFQVPLLIGAAAALMIANVYLYLRLDRLSGEMTKMQDSISREVTQLRESSSLSATAHQQRMEALQQKLETARRESSAAAGQARATAIKRADQIARELKDAQQQVALELTEVKQAASTANTKLADVTSDVGNVKTEVASTKSELDKTIADLKRVNGDMGVMSGLIATNSAELSALRALGDRNYFEFVISRNKQAQRVGDITLLLKKADAKRNRFTVEVMADDKRVEKKDKTTNEPVQFYVAKARQPYEIVVNEVGKDQITGYLSTPKLQVARK
jgi:chromosome segregation ATPase